MTETVLDLRDVAVAYDGTTVLRVENLGVRRGEILTLLGENGSGKSTLLRLCGLLVRPHQGRVVFGGEEVDFRRPGRLLELRRRMATVMQDPLLCRMTVRKNVAMGLRFRRLPGDEIDGRVNTWLRRLSIAHLGDRRAHTLSGGEAQRTSLARAMALDPELLFLDEPFGALDAPTRQNLLGEARGLLAESGVTTVFATHHRGEALALGDRVAVLVGGRIAQIGSPEAVFSRPASLEVARFLGVDTLIPGKVKGKDGEFADVACGSFGIRARENGEVGQQVVAAIRPEEIEIHGEATPEEGAQENLLQGRITRVLPAETHYRVEIDCGVRVVAAVGRARFRHLALWEGSSVHLTFPARAVHLIIPR